MQSLADLLVENGSNGAHILLDDQKTLIRLSIQTIHADTHPIVDVLVLLIADSGTLLLVGTHADAGNEGLTAVGTLLQHLAAVDQVFLQSHPKGSNVIVIKGGLKDWAIITVNVWASNHSLQKRHDDFSYLTMVVDFGGLSLWLWF